MALFRTNGELSWNLFGVVRVMRLTISFRSVQYSTHTTAPATAAVSPIRAYTIRRSGWNG